MRKYLRGGVGALFIGLMLALTTGVGVIVSALLGFFLGRLFRR